MPDDRAALTARVQALADAGKSEDEIVALLSSTKGVPSSIARDPGDLGPTPNGAPLDMLAAQDQKTAPSTPPEPDKPGLLRRVGRGAANFGRALLDAPGKVAGNLGQAADALESGFSSVATLGAVSPEGARRQMAYYHDHPDEFPGRNIRSWADIEKDPATLAKIQQEEKANADQPIVNMVGGLLAPSPGKLAAGAVMKALPGASAVGRVLSATAGGAVGGAAEGGGQSMVRGDAPLDMLTASLRGAGQGAAMGAGVSGLAEGSRAALGSAFPMVAEYARAKDAGRLPEAEALPSGGKGVDIAATRARDRVLGREAQLDADANAAHSSVVDEVSGRQANLDPAVQRLAELQARTRYASGDVIRGREGIDKAARATYDNLTNPGEGADLIPAPDAVAVPRSASNRRTVGDVIQARRAAGEAAGFGNPAPSDSQAANREIYRSLRASVREAQPEIAAADDAMTAHLSQRTRRRQILGLNPDAPSEIRPVDAEAIEASAPAPARMSPQEEIKAARVLGRVGDKTKPGREIAPYLEELAKQDPEFSAALDQLMAKKALEETKFGGVGEALQTPLHGAAGLGSAIEFGKKNLGALARRVDDKALRSMQTPASAGNAPAILDPIQAMLARVQAERELAAREEEWRQRNQSRQGAIP